MSGKGRLGYHMGDNLRWLAEQDHRPDYMPCGVLTGMFLKEVADKLERQSAEKFEQAVVG